MRLAPRRNRHLVSRAAGPVRPRNLPRPPGACTAMSPTTSPLRRLLACVALAAVTSVPLVQASSAAAGPSTDPALEEAKAAIVTAKAAVDQAKSAKDAALADR